MSFFSQTSWQGESKIGLPKCGTCGLSRNCYSPKMPHGGTGERPILFIGEFPSEADDREGGHFLGKRGSVLKAFIKLAGEKINDCWLTNSIICRPSNSEDLNHHIECCLPTLLKTIDKLKPKVIVPMGGAAVKALLGAEWGKSVKRLQRWTGFSIPSSKFNAWICPVQAASSTFLNDAELWERFIAEQIQSAFDYIDKPLNNVDIEDLKKQVEIILDPREARRRMKDLSEKSGLCAFDYETTGVKPDDERQEIVSVSFCHEGTDTFACMIDQNNPADLKGISRILRNPDLKMIASNSKFEERWSVSKLGHGIADWYWDTMVIAHLLDNRPEITSIKFQAYIHLGVGDYDSHIAPYLKSKSNSHFNQIRKLNKEDLLLYNGLDSILEYLVAMRQRGILNAQVAD